MPDDAKPRVAETNFRVRFAETDQMGIVHHAAYVVYMEEGRSELTRQFGASYASLEESGYSLAVTELNVRYVAAARYDQRLTVRTWIAQLQSRGLTMQYEIVNAETGQVLATGLSKHICIDHEGQVRRLPDAWIQTFKQADPLL